MQQFFHYLNRRLLIGIPLLLFLFSACLSSAMAQTAKPTRQPSEQQQANRERKEAESKAQEKEAQKQPGVRCSRLHANKKKGSQR